MQSRSVPAVAIQPSGRPPAPELACQVEVHDRYQFDLKVTYPLRGGHEADETDYQVDLYLFLPKNLRVSSRTYPAARLLEDIQAYLRLDAPEFGDRLEADPGSPLSALADSLRRRAEGTGLPRVQEMVNQARLCACVVVEAVRDAGAAVRQGTPAGEAFRGVLSAVRALRTLRRRYDYHAVDVGPVVLRELRLCDEWLSLTLEEAFAACTPHTDPAHTAALAAEEIAYRRRAGFLCLGSGARDSTRDEYFLYRRGQLKKHVQQVLFLDVRERPAGAKVQQAVAAVGAALAASWALWAQSSTAGGSSTFLLFCVGVVAYIAKDRIKELTRQKLQQRLRRFMPDQSSEIVGGTGLYDASLHGRCYESVRYVATSELPADVTRARDLHHVVDLGDDRADEVLHYRKRMHFEGELLARDLGASVRDIVRLGIRDFTEHLDDPKREVTFFDPNVGAFVSRRAPKVYHLNLVLRYQTEGATDVSFERVRAIVSRKGIVRVDVVLPRTAASALAQTLDPVA